MRETERKPEKEEGGGRWAWKEEMCAFVECSKKTFVLWYSCCMYPSHGSLS